MKLVTWNVNSVRARHDRVVAFLDRETPDIVCLQELKVVDDAFPHEAIAARGYHVETHGQPTYNGVAILSRTPLRDIARGFSDGDDDDPQARLITATVDGPGGDAVRVTSAYIPNGSTVGSDKWAYKLAWMARLRAALDGLSGGHPYVLCGDFNVAPDDRDAHNPARWAASVLMHADARAALAAWRAWGLEDTVRALHPDADEGPFTWWDYRNLGFPKNDGLRIDHVYATPSLAARATEARVDRDERRAPKDATPPSDHAPLLVTFS